MPVALHDAAGVFLANRQWREAETALRAALAVQEPLVARFPADTYFRSSLAMSYSRLGYVLTMASRLREAQEACRKALHLQKQLANDFPGIPVYKNDFARTLTCLAEASVADYPEQARRLLEEALPYNKLALEADPGNIDYLSVFYENYTHQLNVFLKLHDHAAAIAAADVAEPVVHTSNDLYEIVCMYSECVKLAAEDAKLSEAKRKELRKSYGDRAMNALRRAIGLGYEDVDNLKKDKHLDPLRGRDDFKKLLTTLEKPAQKKTKP